MSHSSRAPWLDLLRLVAASAVYAFHALYLFPNIGRVPHAGALIEAISAYGCLGVEAFFMISGYVIVMSAAGRNQIEFARARFMRLWPPFLICALATQYVRFLGGTALDATSMLGNLTMLPGIMGLPPLDPVYWSLMFEILFYVFVATMLGRLFVPRLRIFAIGWLVLAIINRMIHVPGATLFALEFAPYFVVGISVYLIRFENRKADWLLGLAATPAAMIIAAQQSLNSTFRPNPLIVALVVGLCAAAVFFASNAKTGPKLAALMFVAGGISYPLYLIHSEIGTALEIWCLPWGLTGGALTVTVVFALSYGVWRMEGPMRKILTAYPLAARTLRPVASASPPPASLIR
jgi:peptidoglycan/LPS O-acetylase OafA/YrhL